MIMDDAYGLLGVSNLGQEDTAGDNNVRISAAVGTLLRVSLNFKSAVTIIVA